MGTESNNIGTINSAQTPISPGVSENRVSDTDSNTYELVLASHNIPYAI